MAAYPVTPTSTKSFEIHTARAFLDELLRPAFIDFRKDRLSSRKAITCIIFAWQLKDWVWVYHRPDINTRLGVSTQKDFDAYLTSKSPELAICFDIATGSKHGGKSNGSTVKVTGITHGHASLPLGIPQAHLEIKLDNRSYFAEHVAAKALAFWDELFSTFPPLSAEK